MENYIIAETDPKVLLPVNPIAALEVSYSGLERAVLRLAILSGYSEFQESGATSAAQYLLDSGVIQIANMKALQLLKKFRDRTIHSAEPLNYATAKEYTLLVAAEREKIEKIIARVRDQKFSKAA